MTKPQIWVAAFLVLFILLFLLQRATKQEELQDSKIGMNTVPQSNISSENISGKDLVARVGCYNCHGSNLTGTVKGPSLIGVKEFWTRDQLINYLRNPNSFMSSDRFKDYKEKYPNVMMPSYNNIDVKDLGKIAEYLLTL
ncbi:MAG: cytochrome c [Ignavibacteriaceae bacterium]|nr:cytochrome c [Ignavibacteriaceae bacterium]